VQIKEQSQETSVYILYRDIRTYGFIESKYNLAREKGVIFIRYDKEGKPKIKSSGKGLEVLVKELMLNEELLISADIVVLSPAIVADEGNENLAKMLKIPLNEDGFFLEAHVKLRPVDFATEGIFLAGMAHAPKSIEESISQAHAAAARSCVIISKPKYSAEPRVATVNEDLCAGCGICVSVCPYGASAIEIKDEKRVSVINEALCKGCGSCVATCPSGALNQQGFMLEQMRVMVKEALG
jgi:heterodisulfide reductase subunit A